MKFLTIAIVLCIGYLDSVYSLKYEDCGTGEHRIIYVERLKVKPKDPDIHKDVYFDVKIKVKKTLPNDTIVSIKATRHVDAVLGKIPIPILCPGSVRFGACDFKMGDSFKNNDVCKYLKHDKGKCGWPAVKGTYTTDKKKAMKLVPEDQSTYGAEKGDYTAELKFFSKNRELGCVKGSFTLKYFSRNVNFWKERGVNGPSPLPLFGNILEVFTTPINILELQRSHKYGKIYGYLDMSQPVLSVSDVDLLKLMIIKDSNIFTNHLNLSPGDPLLSSMIFNLEDDEWKRVRNISTPAFTALKTKQMFELISKCVDNTLPYLNEVAVSSKEIDMKKTLVSYTLDVIAVCVFGVEFNSYKNPDGDFAKYAYSLTDFARLRVIVGLLIPTFLRQALGFQLFEPSSVNYFKNVLKQAIIERRGKQTNHKDLVKILLECEISDAKDLNKFSEEGFSNSETFEMKSVKQNKRKLNDDEMLPICLAMTFAGTETVSTTLNFLIWTLAIRTDIQEKLYNELKHHFENETHNYDSLLNLPYLDAVINETLRRFTPVCQFDHVCKCDYKLGDTGITIPKGTLINIPCHAVHHDSDYWPQPFEFMPERFLPENKSRIIPYTFLPFGIGPRICLGMKFGYLMVKAMVAKLVFNFEIMKTKNTVTEPVYNGKKFVTHCNPLYITLRNRN